MKLDEENIIGIIVGIICAGIIYFVLTALVDDLEDNIKLMEKFNKGVEVRCSDDNIHYDINSSRWFCTGNYLYNTDNTKPYKRFYIGRCEEK